MYREMNIQRYCFITINICLFTVFCFSNTLQVSPVLLNHSNVQKAMWSQLKCSNCEVKLCSKIVNGKNMTC